LIPTVLARSIADAITGNMVAMVTVRFRFQIGGGTEDALGIEGADWRALQNDAQIASGRTPATGEVSFLMNPGEEAVLEILGTEYRVTLHPGIAANDTLAGRQKRLDMLGYMTGYQLTPIADNAPDDGTDGPRTQQAIMNFQMDQNIGVDGEIGNQTAQALARAAGV
jgi:hypothetical protein